MSRLLCTLAVLAFVAAPASAQRFAQDARATIPLPGVVGAGNTGVAMPSATTSFFYNPAHIARVDLARPRIVFLGVRAQASTDIFDKVDFALNRLDDAIEQGFDELSQGELRALYKDALAIGRKQGVARVSAEIPTVQFRASGLGIGVGAFGSNVTRLRFEPGVVGVPRVDGFAQVDAIGAVNVGGVVPGTSLVPGMGSLAVGVTGKFVRRYFTYKNKSIDSFTETEPVGTFSGNTVAFDLGVHYANVVPMIPGSVDFGLAVYDLIGGSFDYALDATFGSEDNYSEAEERQVLAAFEDRDGTPSYRAGVTYTLPAFASLRALSRLAVSVDYASASTSEFDQPGLGKFSIGTTAEIANFLALRTGMSQGYASFGAGLHTGFAEIDYAFFGVENGRLPGQSARFNHLVQLRFGIL